MTLSPTPTPTPTPTPAPAPPRCRNAYCAVPLDRDKHETRRCKPCEHYHHRTGMERPRWLVLEYQAKRQRAQKGASA